MTAFFDKYEPILGKPNGRPAGVRNGQGQQPTKPSNPSMDGMKHTITKLRDDIIGPITPSPMPTYDELRKTVQQHKVRNAQPKPIPTLEVKQKSVMKKEEAGLKHGVSWQHEIETLNAWLNAIKQ